MNWSLQVVPSYSCSFAFSIDVVPHQALLLEASSCIASYVCSYFTGSGLSQVKGISRAVKAVVLE